ncbi:MAG: DNA-3-methyladenine glycosylase I [Candidatus Thermoplasmatota archaeon]|jgi:DNA-3-methyladenine glycosylase I|nr:DNA-3-methyladenine glycosylase I [Candidatus Thermoplasmatota archaeon]MCL5786272.1 DNA-3-methyladenine glycosylase I [Candidatus Thermoplasmatota archaeon]
MADVERCGWVPLSDPIYVEYHDREWGVPVHDDRRHFEFLVLEGAQAGLSWKTVLYKRENYRKAFLGFDPEKVARFTDANVQELMKDSGIIRNGLKIRSVIQNAASFLAVRDEFGSFDEYVWRFMGNRTLVNGWHNISQVPARTAESDAMSRDLIKRGFRFVGSTICYSHMQATGLVNDHTTQCFRFRELTRQS